MTVNERLMQRSNHNENIGKKFGRLTVLSVYPTKKYYQYNCKCDCGTLCSVYTFSILKGVSSSCGCLQREIASFSKTEPYTSLKKDGKSAANTMFLYYKSNAKKRGYNFDITLEHFLYLTKLNCNFCGNPPSKLYRPQKTRKNKTPYLCNGIDRLDNTIGYNITNCVSCCTDCNMGKGVKTKQGFLTWIERVYLYNKGLL